MHNLQELLNKWGQVKTKAVESVRRRISQWKEDDDVLEGFLFCFPFPLSCRSEGSSVHPIFPDSQILTEVMLSDHSACFVPSRCSDTNKSTSHLYFQQEPGGPTSLGRQEEWLHAEAVVRPQLLYSRALHVNTNKHWKSDMAWFALRSHMTSPCSQSHLPRSLIRTYIHTPEAPSLPPHKSCTENAI